jgi:hypothetical protein
MNEESRAPRSPSKRSTGMARDINLTMSGHHPPAKHRKPPVRLCPSVRSIHPDQSPLSGMTCRLADGDGWLAQQSFFLRVGEFHRSK